MDLEAEGGRVVESIWDLIRAQPITNRLYEVNKANEEAASIRNKAVKTSPQIPIVPVENTAVHLEGPAYSVTLSEQAKVASLQNLSDNDVIKPDIV